MTIYREYQDLELRIKKSRKHIEKIENALSICAHALTPEVAHKD
jgi:hypothetical protein